MNTIRFPFAYHAALPPTTAHRDRFARFTQGSRSEAHDCYEAALNGVRR